MVTIVSTESVLNPRSKAWSLIIKEKSTIANGRSSVAIRAFVYINIVMMLYRNISPEIPRRDPYLRRQFVNTIYRSTSITAGNHQLMTNNSDNILFILSAQLANINLPHLDKLINNCGMSDCSYYNISCS